ncbi:MAG: hypothetical protein ACXAEF_01810 [Candidatus Thorarchaeota archaeon]|jgi:hypothetical protein
MEYARYQGQRGILYMNIKSLYIIKRETGVCMYHKDFIEAVFDPDLISSFLVAMTSFFDEATQSIASRARAFEGTDYKIMVEFGEWTLGALSAVEEDEHLRHKLKEVIRIFEEQFNLLRWVEMDLAVYSRFERHVIEGFLRDEVKPDSVMRQKLNWDFSIKDPEVLSFLKLLPEKISVKDAAEFLEMPIEVALNLATEALWEKAISIRNPVKPEDIYQTTSLERTGDAIEGVSPEASAALHELNGEIPLSIAAERVKTKDLRQFLDEIGVLAERDAVELVSRSQATLVQHSAVLQDVVGNCSRLLGLRATRNIFLESRSALSEIYTWLSFVDLEEGVDIEIRGSLASAAIKGRITSEILVDGFTALIQFITKRVSMLVGRSTVNRVISKSRLDIEKTYPKTAYEVQWERMTVK